MKWNGWCWWIPTSQPVSQSVRFSCSAFLFSMKLWILTESCILHFSCSSFLECNIHNTDIWLNYYCIFSMKKRASEQKLKIGSIRNSGSTSKPVITMEHSKWWMCLHANCSSYHKFSMDWWMNGWLIGWLVGWMDGGNPFSLLFIWNRFKCIFCYNSLEQLPLIGFLYSCGFLVENMLQV